MSQQFRRRHRPVKGVEYSRDGHRFKIQEVGRVINHAELDVVGPAAESLLFRTCQGLLTDNLSLAPAYLRHDTAADVTTYRSLTQPETEILSRILRCISLE